MFLLFFHTIKQCVAKETSSFRPAVCMNQKNLLETMQPSLPLLIIQYAFICILFITRAAAAQCYTQKHRLWFRSSAAKISRCRCCSRMQINRILHVLDVKVL